jgi:hypothetical protein
MKRISAAGVFVVLALWLGYALGYYHGRRYERAAWKAMEVVEFDRDDEPPMIWTKSSGQWLTNQVKIDRKGRLHVYYTDPNVTEGHEYFDRPPVNVPDPRNMPLN